MKQFYKKVDLRNRREMVDFLSNHFRYSTMNSWNNATSYANNVKIYTLGLPRELEKKAYDLIETDEAWDILNSIISEWGRSHSYAWQAGFNGRSGGYLVMYRGGCRPSGYKSYCAACGQRNYKLAPPENPSPEQKLKLEIALKKFWTDEVIYQNFTEKFMALDINREEALKIIREEKIKNCEYTGDNRCGRCGSHSQVNYEKGKEPVEIFSYPGKSVDMDVDFCEWSMDDLRERVKLVQDFDRLCDRLLAIMVDICDNYEIVEENVCVPRKIRVLRAIS
ncbi:MAG: hypothetical protein ACOY4I_05445 [Bacillota bacterium]